MQKITIISVGKIKEKYFTSAINEYTKRLGRYCQLKQIEIKDEKAAENLSKADLEIIKKREGERVLAHIKNNQYVITLEINGKQFSSTQLATHLQKLATNGKSNLIFIIGGSNGLAPIVSQKADLKISFSDMTFPHQLMRIILLEQIYRTFRILKNEPYHK